MPPELSDAVAAAKAPVSCGVAEAATRDPTIDSLDAAASSSADPALSRGWSPPIDGHGLFKSLMLRLPRGVRTSLDHEQLLALRQAAEEVAWGEHPIDIRLSVPWLGGRRYILLIAGKERRELTRPVGQRRRSSPVRVGNHASLATLVGLGAGLALLIGLATSALTGG